MSNKNIDTDPTQNARDRLAQQHRDAAEGPVQKSSRVIDHLVDALAGDPSSSLRRVATLIDIAQHPGTSQSGIIERCQYDKSSIARDIDWLYNYGCVTRRASENSGREVALMICGFSRTHLLHAAAMMDGDLERLQNFVQGYITLFKGYRATLRDMKIITVLAEKGQASRADLLDALYNGPVSTDTRAVMALIENGFVSTDDGQRYV